MSDLYNLLRSEDQLEANGALDALKNRPVGEVVKILEQLAVESEPEYRCRAVVGMVNVAPEQGESLAIRLLKDVDESVRWHACNSLCRLKSKKALPLISDLLLKDPSDLVRDCAAFCLGQIGDESVLPVLHLAAEEDSGTDYEGRPIRETANKSIQKIRSRLP